MSNTRLLPHFDIRAPMGEPSHPPFSLFATSDEKYEQARLAGGIRNVVRYHLDNDFYVRDDDDEGRRANRNRAVSLPFALLDQPELSSITSFETVATPQEKDQLDHQVAKYTALRDALILEDNASPNPLSDEKQNLLASYRRLVDACSLAQGIVGRQLGFLEEIEDIFGIGGSALRDINSAPNTDKIRRSTFQIPRNHPFYLALHFDEPERDQRETDFQIAFGPFLLHIRGGRRASLSLISSTYFYDSKKQAELQTALARLETLLDESRITAQDAIFIDNKEAEIDTLTESVRKLKRTDAAYIAAHRDIATARQAIAQRRALKARAPGNSRTEIKEIHDKYFEFAEISLNLNESSENFYGDKGMMRLIFMPQSRGYLTIALNNQRLVTVGIPSILESKSYGVIYESTLLALRSNGGSFTFKPGFPTVGSDGEYRIPGISTGFVISDEEMETLVAEGDWDIGNPGCDITFFLERSANFRQDDPRYDFVARLTSTKTILPFPLNLAEPQNEYFPFLYNVRVFLNSGAIPDNNVVLWSTRRIRDAYRVQHGFAPNPSFDSPIRNITFSCDSVEDSKRGSSLVVELNDPNGTLGFPADGYKNHMCDCSVAIFDYDTMTQSGESDVLSNGVIREAVLMNARLLSDGTTVEEIAEGFGPDSFWRLVVADLWSLADDYEITCDVILDGLTLGQQWKRLLGLRGWKGVWTQFIQESGDMAGEVAPRAGPGEKPKKAPRVGMRLGAALRACLDEFGVTDDNRELRGRIQSGVWTLDAPTDEVKFSFSGSAHYEGTQPVFAGASRAEDWSRFYNIFTLEGGQERGGGGRLSVTLTIFESLDNPDSPIYWGSPKPAPLIIRQDLTTQVEVERAVEVAAIKNSKSGDLRHFPSMWLYPLPAIGDRGTVDGQIMELVAIGSMSLMDLTESELTLRPYIRHPF